MSRVQRLDRRRVSRINRAFGKEMIRCLAKRGRTIDRDDVIKRLERACLLVWNGDDKYNIIEAEDTRYVAYAIHDAIALLEKQKAVKPEWWQGKAYCGGCGAKLPAQKYNINFCGKCGHMIDWGDD